MLSNITFKHRLIGGIFLVSLAVIIVPALFDTPRVDDLSSAESPEAPLKAAWEELDKIEYTFTELAQAEAEILSPAPQEIVAEPVISEHIPAEHSQDAQIVETPTPEIAAVSSEKHSGTSHPTTPAPEPKPVPAPSPKMIEPVVIAATERLIAAENWAVQLGAFSKIENAKALAKRLEEKGYQVYLDEMSSTKLTRVLVGTKPDKQQASELMTELDKNLQMKGILVKYNPQS